MRVAQGSVGDQQALFLARPGGKFLRTLLQQNLPCARGRILIAVIGRLRDWRKRLLHLEALGLRIAVHHHISNVLKQPVRAIAARPEGEEFRRGIDQRRTRLPRAEGLILDDVFDERNVRLHAANPKFLQRAVHAIKRNREAHAAGGDLDQQRIIKRRDHTARIALTAVQSQPEPGSRAVGNDAPIIGCEIIGRILRGHTRLHGVTNTAPSFAWATALRPRAVPALAPPESAPAQGLCRSPLR